MKINAKDITAGAFLVLVAAVGLWLNQDHALGSARRMGPGYMPMLVFWVQIVLGAIVLGTALFNGPDPLEKWTGIEIGTLLLGIAAGTAAMLIAPQLSEFFVTSYGSLGFGMLVGFLVISIVSGWRLIGFICAAMCAFCLLLEKGGLMLSLVATIIIASMAEPEHRQRPLGVLAMTVF